ncbi:DUF1624 domain-containing protein [Arthrobacter crusticola]|uniref:DUF1624 domain-containing protein n=1 Tax=Arthrobacter crusticola TaxID=2547960 RepID=A0A4R5TX65_9MICC|nr:heparan-alpha-glucosaminide N-acetyltransferase domain-containing protein [Arthrobacter crusticola]TDK25776.1 DUF1624 domain-containing protein [Arthrobacter crusticola]
MFTTVSSRDASSTTGSRLTGIDAARGLALIGLMVIHTLPLEDDEGNPTLLWTVFSGHSAAQFALLAGVALTFSSGGREPLNGRPLRSARAGVAVRAALITLLGLTIAYVDTPPAIILAYYGVMFFLAIPLLGLGARALAAIAAGLALTAPVLAQGLRDSLPEPGFNPTLTDLLAEPGVVITQLLLTGDYPAVLYLAYICAGLAIGRLDLHSRLVQIRLAAAGLVLAAVSWLLSALLLGPWGGLSRLQDASSDLDAEAIDEIITWGPEDYVPTDSLWWQALATGHSNTVLEKLNTIGTATAVLAAFLLLARVAARILIPLAALGSMTLTLYSAHLLVLATGFLEEDPVALVITQICGAAVFALAWRHTRRHGPLEGIVASASRRARTLGS